MHNLLKMTWFADICLQRMFFNTLKAETNPKSATNAFVYDKVLLLSSLESTFVAIHGRRRLLWCVLFKCLRCTSNLYLFSITKSSVLFFYSIMWSTWYFVKCHKLAHLRLDHLRRWWTAQRHHVLRSAWTGQRIVQHLSETGRVAWETSKSEFGGWRAKEDANWWRYKIKKLWPK